MATTPDPPSSLANMSLVERFAYLTGGSLLAVYGLRRRDAAGAMMAVAGGGVALQGARGHSVLNHSLGVHRFAGSGGAENVLRGQAVHVERSITVMRPVHAVYRFWRRLENLPRFVDDLVAVEPVEATRHHWVARAPVGTVEWDSEILEEQSPWLVSWRSVPGSQIQNAGSVRFSPALGWEGTEVRVSLAYKPPAGVFGALLARAAGREPSLQVEHALKRFKEIMESQPARDETATEAAGSRSH